MVVGLSVKLQLIFCTVQAAIIYIVSVTNSWRQGAEERSWFVDSWLVCRRATIEAALWLPSSKVFLPVTEPGQSNVPAASCLEKRAAQLLGGDDVPQKLLESLFRDGSPSLQKP